MWMRTKTDYVNADIAPVYSDPVCISGSKGDDGKQGEDAVLLMIDSSNGNMFKNSKIATTLTVTIIKGDTMITSSRQMNEVFGASAKLIWDYRSLGETEGTTLPANDSRLSDNGFILTLNADDIQTKAVFSCSLDY